MTAILLLFAAAIPITLSVWALLDAAKRPAWAWSLADKSQLGWLVAISIGIFLMLLGVTVALWYLIVVRPVIKAIEDGDIGDIGGA